MNRTAFLLKMKKGFASAIAPYIPMVSMAEDVLQLSNFSVWSVKDFAFCYAELPGDMELGATEEQCAQIRQVLDDLCEHVDNAFEVIAYPGEMRLMYHDIGEVRADKSLIRHRVFATHIKPGCADEYNARHENLIKSRGGDSFGAESNFTIWCAKDEFNFGYCELVKAFDHEPTEEEKQATIAWETKQLEIMDWYTDDVDWMTGKFHPKMALLYAREAYDA